MTERRGGSARRRRERQLLASGGIFALLVMAKLALPAQLQRFDELAEEVIGRNMDVREVFSAVGRGVSGEISPEESLKNACRAAFRTEKETAVEVVEQQEIPAEDTPPTEDQVDTCILYAPQNLPAHVSMEQPVLGFAFTTPVTGTLTSGFGYREHPIQGEERFHYGVDLAAETGTEIRCFADGTVGAVGESNSYGNYLIVHHAGGYETLYAHCSRVTVPSGAEVKRGEPIAEVGETGMATGPHLHFELHRDGIYLNPIYYVSQS